MWGRRCSGWVGGWVGLFFTRGAAWTCRESLPSCLPARPRARMAAGCWQGREREEGACRLRGRLRQWLGGSGASGRWNATSGPTLSPLKVAHPKGRARGLFNVSARTQHPPPAPPASPNYRCQTRTSRAAPVSSVTRWWSHCATWRPPRHPPTSPRQTATTL